MYHSLVKLGDCYLLKNMTMLHECINNLGLQSAVRLYEKTVATEKVKPKPLCTTRTEQDILCDRDAEWSVIMLG